MKRNIPEKNGCSGYQSNNPLDPPEWDCGYDTIISCDECIYVTQKYGKRGKNPEAKCNQNKDI